MPKTKNKSKAGSDKLLEAHLAEQLGDGSARTSNADLEAKVIGAAFKRPSELQSIVSYLTADDFSDPRNKVFFNYIHDCYRSGKYPDTEVCIANALRNPDYEIEPEHYKEAMARCMEGDNSLDIQSACGVIHDLYVVRNLLGLAKRIEANVAQGKSSSDIVAQAETIFKTLSTDLYADDTLKDIDQLVDGLKGGWDEFLNPSVKAIPSPWSDLNGYIGGWKPGYFYVVGARPGVGKSVFLAQSAYHAAVYDPAFKIAVFSHEMDGLDIWQRILCSQVGVLSDDFNQSSLSKSDKDRLTEYYRKSARRNIYISDRGGKTPLSLRSEVARFKAKHGRIDMVVIDYIQLMNIPGAKASERTQEVGAISRAIKSLAMEFNVPILTAAQLNREAVKLGKDSRPALSDLRESGCLSGDTWVTMSNGERIQIRDLSRFGDRCVMGVGDEYRIGSYPVVNAFSTGIKPVYSLNLTSGKSIKATADHMFMTSKGWMRLDAIASGDRVACPRIVNPIDVNYASRMSLEKAEFIGHMIGDGTTLKTSALKYTTGSMELAERIVVLSNRVFGESIKPRVEDQRNEASRCIQVFLPSSAPLSRSTRNPITVMMSEIGCFGFTAIGKKVPDCMFSESVENVKAFLSGLWCTDGHIGFNKIPSVHYSTISYQLAHGVSSLLLRLGVVARVDRVPQKNSVNDCFSVSVTGKDNISKFMDSIMVMAPSHREKMGLIMEYLSSKVGNTNVDTVPNEMFYSHAKDAQLSLGLTNRDIDNIIGTRYLPESRSNYGRPRLNVLADALKSDRLKTLANSDIFWDEVCSIEYSGEEEVFDLTVDNVHNFIANDIVVHNCIEQDADVVIFPHRPSMNWTKPTPAPDDLFIIAKQRRGRTGDVVVEYKGSNYMFVQKM